MGLLTVLRSARRGAGRGPQGEAPGEQPGAAGSRGRSLAADAASAADALGDLKALERRYGAGVAPAAVRLRNAVLLHRAGHKAEAWAAFERLLADPALGGSPAVRPAMQSEVYARVRIALEREGCPNPALTPAVLSYATRAQFYALAGRDAQLDLLRRAARIDHHFTPLLERARLAPVLPALRRVLDEHLSSLPDLDLAALRAAIEALRLSAPAPVAPARGKR